MYFKIYKVHFFFHAYVRLQVDYITLARSCCVVVYFLVGQFVILINKVHIYTLPQFSLFSLEAQDMNVLPCLNNFFLSVPHCIHITPRSLYVHHLSIHEKITTMLLFYCVYTFMWAKSSITAREKNIFYFSLVGCR